MNTTKLFFMAALVVIFAACSNDDDELIQQPAKMITITAQLAPKSESASTRAVSESGDNIVVDWAVNEQLKIISANGYYATATITDVDGSGVATISFSIVSSAQNKDCTIIYPSDAAVTEKNGVFTANPITAQDGTLNASLDVRIGKGHITNEATPTLDVTTQPAAQFSIFKFTIKNAAGNANVNVKPFNINIGAQTYVITPASATNTLYAALPDVSNRKFYFFATGSDNKTYIFSKANVSFDKGYYYKSTLKMTKADGLLPGIFTINEYDKKVYFSQGNLQAKTTDNGSAWTWSFATNQWDFIGGRSYSGHETETGNNYITGNGTMSANGTVDLFGWSTSATYYGIHNSENSNSTTNDYAGNFVDWGNTIGTGWRTLTLAERQYLFNTRIGSTVNGTPRARYTLATINTDKTGVNGVILFPDGLTFASSEFNNLGTINGAGDCWTTCTEDKWTALAAKGCVFLPAAGSRNGTTVINAGTHGYYWSSEKYGDTGASGLSFENELNANASSNDNRYYGYSVRLVYDAN